MPINQTVKDAWTQIWRVYKLTFASDGYAYVGITNQPIPDRIQGHIRTPVNAELSSRLRNNLPYSVEVLHEVEIEGGDGNGIRCIYALEREEIAKLKKPINICGISLDAKRNEKNWKHEQTEDNKKRKQRRRTKRNVHPPREGIYRCTICREPKPHTKFHKSRGRFNGLDSRCKSCCAKQRKLGREKGRRMITSKEARDHIHNRTFNPNILQRLPTQEIIECYCEKELTTTEIAALFNCSPSGVSNLLKREGVLRTREEAWVLRKKRMKKITKSNA